MKFSRLFAVTLCSLLFISCDINNDDTKVEAPASYEFTRNGSSTVSFSGQTTRIKMATELINSVNDFDNSTEELLLEMYRNQSADGGDANPYSDPELNQATKSVKSKVAASNDFFSANATVSAELKAEFENWISAQVNEVYPNENTMAAPGVAGQIADGSSTRYVNAQGLEYKQLINKGLIGALMTDQMLNNYLSENVLDAGTNMEDNSEKVLKSGANYTVMEHKWDEAYGYLYGTSQDYTNPNSSIGSDDSFLNKYVGSANSDADFEGIATDIFDAFKLGRAAIVENAYDLRNEQAQIIRKNISMIIGIRAVHYLQAGKSALDQEAPEYGTAFHDLSEAYGFIFSLQFTRVPNSDSPYFTKAEVDAYLSQLTEGNGLWEVSPQTLENMSVEIAERFDFTVEQAAN